MKLEPFEAMIRRMTTEVPVDYFDGVTEVVVSPRAVAHPTRDEIYTLGECIPLALGDDAPEEVQSRVVLYHGSFTALAELDDTFDWEAEAWETLTHELRHHVEWRARRDELEDFDRASEANYARHDGDAFDPLFFLDGEPAGDDTYQVDDDWFLDLVARSVPSVVEFNWRGHSYSAAVPAGVTLPAYLLVHDVADSPDGDLVLVLRRKASVFDLFRTVPLHLGEVTALRRTEE